MVSTLCVCVWGGFGRGVGRVVCVCGGGGGGVAANLGQIFYTECVGGTT